MKKILLIIVLIICILLGVFALATVSSYPVGNAVDTIEIRDGHTGKEYVLNEFYSAELLEKLSNVNYKISGPRVLAFGYSYIVDFQNGGGHNKIVVHSYEAIESGLFTYAADANVVEIIKASIEDASTGERYEQFCKEQKALLDTYLQNNPYLSVLCFNYGYDKPDAIKLAAVCYNKSTNQDSNLLVFSDVGVGCLTFESDSTDVHYLSEYPLYIYDEDKIELPLFHYDKGLVIFHRVECNFNSETTDANFVVLEEARKSITEIEY